jgi:hypothetical protein
MYRTKDKGKFKYIFKKTLHMEKLLLGGEYARIKYAKKRQQCIEKNLFSHLYNDNKSYDLENWIGGLEPRGSQYLKSPDVVNIDRC